MPNKTIAAFVMLFAGIEAVAQEPYFTKLTDDLDWVTVSAAVYEDSEKGEAFRFATPYKVDLSINNSGTISEFDDGVVTWVLGITSEWSVSLNATLANVELGVEDVIYAYSPDGTDIQTFTFEDNKRNGYMQIVPIAGDSMIIEYQSLSGKRPEFVVETVNCGFISIDNPSQTVRSTNKLGLGASGSCEVDATCYSSVKELMDATCRLIFNGNTYGSGTLVANTQYDKTPYVLTAAHLFDQTFTTCYADFGFYAPNCQSSFSNDRGKRVTGAETLVYIEQSDIALLLLDDTPPEYTEPYWAGWNISSDVEGTVKCLHYPSGDVCKVSYGSGVTQSSYTSATTISGLSFSPNSHWRVPTWTVGTTEGGSSGSGLFNEDGQLIGALTGGYGTCDYPQDDYFWQLCKGWSITDSDHDDASISTYLDPKGSGTTELSGRYEQDVLYNTIYNISTTETIVSEQLSDGWGYLAGNNSSNVTVLAERFDVGDQTVAVDGIRLVAKLWPTIETFYVNIWDVVDGLPGNTIQTYAFDLSGVTLSSTKQYEFQFESSIELTGEFYVGIAVTDPEDSDNLSAFYYSKTAEENTALFRIGKTTWVDYNELAELTGISDGTTEVNCSLFIGLRYEYANDTEVVTKISNTDIQLRFAENDLTITADMLKYITVYDLKGTVVIDMDALDLPWISIDMNSYPSGMYFVRVCTATEKKTFKILNNK